MAIGPESEWDCVKLIDTPGGDLIVSRGAPGVIPLDQDIIVKPLRTAGNDDVPIAKLDLLVFDHVPPAFTGQRVPRVYRSVETTVDTVEHSINLSGRAAAGLFYKPLTVAGAKSFSLYMHNSDSSDAISWRIVGLRGSGGRLYPISPTGYPDAVPTYNTLAAATLEAWHLDVEVDAHEHLVLLVKATGSPLFYTEAEVRD